MASKAVKKRRKQERVAEYKRERGNMLTAAAERRKASGGTSTILVEPTEVRQDCRLVTQAVQQRWPITPDRAAMVVDRLMGIIQTTQVMAPTADGGIGPDQGKADSNAVAASRVLTAMVSQNQRDEQA